MNEPKKPFWVRCSAEACGHCWPAAYLPMEASTFAKLTMRCACPKCGAKKAVIPRQREGVLLDPPASGGNVVPFQSSPK